MGNDEIIHRKDSNELNEKCFKENETFSDIFAPNYEVFIEELNTYINSHNNEKFCCRIEEIPLSMVNQYFLSCLLREHFLDTSQFGWVTKAVFWLAQFQLSD